MPIFSAGSASVSIVPDFSHAQQAITEFFARQSDIKAKVTPDLANGDMARTEAELNALHGEAKVGVDHNFLTSAISTALTESLSRSGLDRLGGLLSAAIGPTVITALGGAFVELAAAASQAVGILALAPALLSAIAAPAAVVALGVHGMGAAFKALDTGNAQQIATAMANLAPAAQQVVTQVHALGPAFHDMRLDVQQSLFAGVGQAVSNLAGVALPILHNGLVGIAGAMNSGLLATMTALQGQGANFSTLFGNIASAVRVASGAAAPLIQAFMTLAAVGSQFLPQLAQGFVNVATKFNDWVQRMSASGQLVTIIQTAINVIDQLGRIAGNVIGIVSGIFTAALPYGNAMLSLLEHLTGDLNTFVHSAQGQSALTSFFGGINQAVAQLIIPLEQVVEAIVTAVLPAIGQFAALLAPIGAQLLVQLAAVLRQVGAILPPVVVVMAALVSAMAPLIPVIGIVITTLLPPLVKLFGDLAPIIGQAAQVLGGVLVAAVEALAPILPPLANAVVSIAQALGGALLAAARAIAPLLPTLANAFLSIVQAIAPLIPPLIRIAEQLFPPLVKVVGALVPVVTGLVGVFAPLVSTLLKIVDATVLPLVVNLITSFAAGLKVLAGFIAPLAPVLQAIAIAIGVWTAAQWLLNFALDANPIGLIILAIAALVIAIGEIVTHIGGLKTAFGDALGFIENLWNTVWGAVSSFFTNIWNGISSFFHGIWSAISSWFTGALNSFTSSWQNGWSSISSFFTNIWNAIRDFFVNIWNAISSWFAGVLQRELQGWQNIWNAVSSFFASIWNGIRDFFVNIWNAISSWFAGALQRELQGWQNIWNAVSSFFVNIWNTLRNFFVNIWNAIYSWFSQQLNTLSTFWQNIWNNISSFFSNIWNAIRTTVVNVWNTITGFLRDGLNAIAGIFNTVWTSIKNGVLDIFRTLLDGIKSAWETLKGIVEAPIRFVVNTVINGFLHGVNAVMSFLHLPWKIPDVPLPFAEGGFTGDGMFGTGGKYDPAGIVHAREFVVNQKQTAKHLPLLQAINSGAGGFADGGLVGGIPSFAGGGLVGEIIGLFTDPVGTVVSFVKGLIGNGAGSGPFADTVTAVPVEMAKQMGGWIGDEVKKGIGAVLKLGGQLASDLTHALGSAFSAVANFFGFGGSGTGKNTAGFSGGGNVAQWTGDVQAVLNMLGRGTGETGAVLRRIQFESGGNPNAINLTDSNARAGHPSQGLMQVIPSTFAAYRNPSLSSNIDDPMANIFAGSNYAVHRYGSLAAIDPLVMPHGYDTGGWLPPGYTHLFNGTGDFEAVLNRAQQSALVGAVNSHSDGVPVWHFYLGDKEITDVVDKRVVYHSTRDGRAIRSSM